VNVDQLAVGRENAADPERNNCESNASKYTKILRTGPSPILVENHMHDDSTKRLRLDAELYGCEPALSLSRLEPKLLLPTPTARKLCTSLESATTQGQKSDRGLGVGFDSPLACRRSAPACNSETPAPLNHAVISA